MNLLTAIRRNHHHNLRTLHSSPLAEISGALGDLGTLLPLMIALALQGSISLSSTLVLSGAFNVATGVIFGIPLPVQPMKAIAAAAIRSHYGLDTTVAAGALVSTVVLIASGTGLLRRFTAVVPVPVVKGIQLGAGLSLVLSAGESLLRPLGWTSPSALDNRFWAIGAFIGLLLSNIPLPIPSVSSRGRFPMPYALLAFLTGLIIALVALLTSHNHASLPRFQPWIPRFTLPNFDYSDAWSMAIAQLPLTTLNSVVAAAALATELFPDRSDTNPDVTSLGISVGIMNLLGCWVGAMPVCHGAGGLAAQYRFGARSGASVVLLGLFKVVVGAVFGTTLLDLLRGFPHAILGVMVVAAGLELAMVGQSLNQGAADLWEGCVDGEDRKQRVVSEEERRERFATMLMTAAGIIAFKNDAVGFVAGMLCHYSYRLAGWAEARSTRGRGIIDGERESLLH